ncbi:uncharacterized protein LOC111216770 isoform X2 [Seriola dumerili]|uniref:uncharacterized protein LOC111216770 isoform X2 n=1 Tax=Seriola dumerili TaxID=41447 RepID=UPI000BBF225A|nr:uncharacterized protein LOC111216770 isoform X2 [Seriola dumerili]
MPSYQTKSQTSALLRRTQQCNPGHMAPQREKVSFVAVDGMKTFLVSAYWEHRTEQKEVHVLAVVLRSKTQSYRCHLCCQDQLHISEDKRDQEFLEVKNQEAKTDSFPYTFTVCISTMFEYTNVLQLVQSLEMLQLLGVNRVVIYKTSCSPKIQRILDYYTRKGLVEVIPWSVSRFVNVSRGWLPEHGPGDLHYFGQIPALCDCTYRYMYESKYVALQDIDELILPQSVNSWLELLPLLENKYGADRCYMFENNVFPITVTQPPPNSQTPPPQSWQNVSGVNILDHLYHEPITEATHFSNFKIIVSPRAAFTPTVHGLLDSVNGCKWVDRNIARMYHTRAAKQPNLKPDQLIYDGRLLNYNTHLTPAVNTVLRESGLLPEGSIQ